MLNKYLIGPAMLLSVMLLLLIDGCTGSGSPPPISDANLLDPGLRVLYFNGKYRNVRQIPNGERAILEKGRPGAPILIINNQFGSNEVFNSGRSQAIGIQMKGYIHLQKGHYEFQALSNDGVEMIIDGRSVIIDPGVHSDRLSKVGTVSVQEAGWHSLMVKYFQRKGTAALKLYWKMPDKSEFEVIPASAYGHLPDNSKDK